MDRVMVRVFDAAGMIYFKAAYLISKKDQTSVDRAMSTISIFMALSVGDIAPDFSLADQHGNKVNLETMLEKGLLVLFFYPKDDTPGCTRQACSFRDNYTLLLSHGVAVAGVSRDSADDHTAFIGKNELPYVLLSDPDGTVHNKYGCLLLFGMLSRRVTFLIDTRKRILLRHEDNFRMNSHVDAVLRALENVRRKSTVDENHHPR